MASSSGANSRPAARITTSTRSACTTTGRPRGKPFLLLDRDGDQLYPDIIRADRDYIVVFSEDNTDEGDVMGCARPPPCARGASPSRSPRALA